MHALRFLAAVATLALVLPLAGCGDEGLPEADRRAFVQSVRTQGEAAERRLLAEHPDDEEARATLFRAEIERIEKTERERYGLTAPQARTIFLEARRKGWW